MGNHETVSPIDILGKNGRRSDDQPAESSTGVLNGVEQTYNGNGVISAILGINEEQEIYDGVQQRELDEYVQASVRDLEVKYHNVDQQTGGHYATETVLAIFGPSIAEKCLGSTAIEEYLSHKGIDAAKTYLGEKMVEEYLDSK